MNNVCLIGNLCRDPLQLSSAAKITIAVKSDDKTDFFTVICFGKTAEYVNNYLSKGNKVAVVGSIHIKEYETKDGKKCKDVEITAVSIQNLTPKTTTEQPKKQEPSFDDDDLPF